MGYRGNVPDEVIELCTGCDLRASHIWSSIQAVLKSNGLRSTPYGPPNKLGYYNRIGQIIWKMVRLKIDFVKRDRVLERIVDEFRQMQFVHVRSRGGFSP